MSAAAGLSTAGAGFQRFARGDRPTRTLVRAIRLTRMAAHLGFAWLGGMAMTSPLGSELRQRAVERWARASLRSLNVELEVRGDPVASGPVMIIANHVSWLDICALNSIAAYRMVSKSEVRSWPVIGPTARRMGHLFHRRWHFRDAARIKNDLADVLRAGGSVAIFPEGTTTDGTVLKPFYAAFAQAAVDAGVLVQPVAIRYTDAIGLLCTDAAFVDDQTFGASLALILRKPRITARLTFGPPFSTSGLGRREVIRAARSHIARSLNLAQFDTALSAPALERYHALYRELELPRSNSLRLLTGDLHTSGSSPCHSPGCVPNSTRSAATSRRPKPPDSGPAGQNSARS